MKKWMIMVVVGFLLCPILRAQDVSAKQAAAVEAAKNWLALVDGGQYGKVGRKHLLFFSQR